ncbi:MAG: hypothetical protein U9N52_04870 [Campylobacterota bacterium]|nr:hypothetical protein [Campylobacterota bacterium]
MKVKKIGDIELTYNLWWTNYNQNQTVKAEAINTIDGGVVVFEQAVATTAKNISLSSMDDGWQDMATKDNLVNLVKNSIGTTTTITTTDDEVIDVRFAHERNSITVESLNNVKLSKYYLIKLELARV